MALKKTYTAAGVTVPDAYRKIVRAEANLEGSGPPIMQLTVAIYVDKAHANVDDRHETKHYEWTTRVRGDEPPKAYPAFDKAANKSAVAAGYEYLKTHEPDFEGAVDD